MSTFVNAFTRQLDRAYFYMPTQENIRQGGQALSETIVRTAPFFLSPLETGAGVAVLHSALRATTQETSFTQAIARGLARAGGATIASAAIHTAQKILSDEQTDYTTKLLLSMGVLSGGLVISSWVDLSLRSVLENTSWPSPARLKRTGKIHMVAGVVAGLGLAAASPVTLGVMLGGSTLIRSLMSRN